MKNKDFYCSSAFDDHYTRILFVLSFMSWLQLLLTKVSFLYVFSLLDTFIELIQDSTLQPIKNCLGARPSTVLAQKKQMEPAWAHSAKKWRQLVHKTDGFLKRSFRYGFTNKLTTIQPLLDSATEDLFCKSHLTTVFIHFSLQTGH